MFEDLFYDRLIKLRERKGVSAREMSLAIGQSPGYINGLENRYGFPSMQVFFYICEYLDVTPSEFFDAERHGGAGRKKPPECTGDHQRAETLSGGRQREKDTGVSIPVSSLLPFTYFQQIRNIAVKIIAQPDDQVCRFLSCLFSFPAAIP